MDFFNLIRGRHSIRAYTDQPIKPEDLQCIFEAINRAPSAGHRQAFEVYILREPGPRGALVHAASEQEFLAQAPVVLVFCTHAALNADRYGQRGDRLYAVQDATIACTFAMLAAAELGLASVWVGAFNEAAVRGVIRAPEEQRPVAILPIGYPAETPRNRERRPLSKLIHEVT